MKDLKDKAIDIKGKSYVLVSDRILAFNEDFPKGEIRTESEFRPEDKTYIVKATIKPVADESRAFTGHSQAVIGEGMVNKTAALENCETSAVGRALAMMGIGVLESIASADEMVKAGAKTEKVNMQTPEGKICDLCGKDAKVSPKSGKLYCENWKQHKEDGKYANMISNEDKEWNDNMPKEEFGDFDKI